MNIIEPPGKLGILLSGPPLQAPDFSLRSSYAASTEHLPEIIPYRTEERGGSCLSVKRIVRCHLFYGRGLGNCTVHSKQYVIILLWWTVQYGTIFFMEGAQETVLYTVVRHYPSLVKPQKRYSRVPSHFRQGLGLLIILWAQETVLYSVVRYHLFSGRVQEAVQYGTIYFPEGPIRNGIVRHHLFFGIFL